MAPSTRKTSIPLRCSLCPKKPRFSDVSHLLTHVSSKGHLAQQFKTTVRASTDTAARDTLQTFNAWYDEHGIAELCANRLRTNEVKKARARSHAAGFTPPAPTPRSVSSLANTTSSAEALRAEPGLDAFLVADENTPPEPGPAEEDDGPGPRMHLWSTDADRLHNAPEPLQLLPSYHPLSNGDATDSFYSGSSSERATYGYGSCSDYTLTSPLDDQFSPSIHDDVPSPPMPDEADFLDCDAQLKGVYWPGMNIFDSAPPAMRRKRNQRKDGSVLAQMQLNSALVEPTELIFWADGDLKKERRIYSPPDCSPEESTRDNTKKRRCSRASRAPLAETSVNLPMPANAARTAKAILSAVTSTSNSPAMTPGSTLARSLARHDGRISSIAHDGKRRPGALGSSGASARRRCSIAVFRDDAGPPKEDMDPSTSPLTRAECTGGLPSLTAPFVDPLSTVVEELEDDASQRPFTSFYKSEADELLDRANEGLLLAYSQPGASRGNRAGSEAMTEKSPASEEPASPSLLPSLPLHDLNPFRAPSNFGYLVNPLLLHAQSVSGLEFFRGYRPGSDADLAPSPFAAGGMRHLSFVQPCKTEKEPTFDPEYSMRAFRG
ncbi:MAG: hypothetical protein M1826_006252 [Phylliscum demangeonii]|nr:MAG: hypothetical protein M1826_006252 [Phylliscum demangeonii]